MTDFEKKMKALKRITDQKQLAEIVKNEYDINVRIQAMWKLTDQDAIADVAKNSDSVYTRMDAAKMLDDKDLAQRIYADIAGSDNDFNVRYNAFEKLTDRALLREVAINGTNIEGCMEALERLGDDELTRQVCTQVALDTDTDDWMSYARLLAVRKLTDQTVLTKVAKNDENDVVRKAAIYRLTDQKVLEEIATNDNEYADISWWAADKIDNRELAQEVYSQICDAAMWDYYDGDDGKIYKRRFDGSDEKEWTVYEAYDVLSDICTEDGSGGFEECNDFTTDGRWIYFTHTVEDSNYIITIYRMRPDGSDLDTLYDLRTDEEEVSIKKVSDGWLYFTQEIPGNWGTEQKIRTDGSDMQEIRSW